MNRIVTVDFDDLQEMIKSAVSSAVREALAGDAASGNSDDLLDARQCAEIMGISINAWYRRAKERSAPPSIGGARNRRWRRGAVMQWIRQQEQDEKYRRQVLGFRKRNT